MKICHVLINYHPSIGGTQLLFKGISEKLVSNFNDNVEVLTINSYFGSHSQKYKPITPLTEIVNGVQVKRFPFYKFHKKILSLVLKFWMRLTGRVLSSLQVRIAGPWSPELTKAMNKIDADVIAASSSGYMFMQYPLYRHKLKNPRPFVVQGAIHFGVYDQHQVVSTETINIIKASEYYIANTQYEKERLVDLGINQEKIKVIGVATDVSFFEEGDKSIYRTKLNIGNEDLVVGYFGRIEKTKNIDVLVDAFILAKKQNEKLKLIIAGFQSDYYTVLNQYIQNSYSYLSKDIFFILNPTDYEKKNVFHAFDIFVLPSNNESFGIVFLEAWACKKPVIGSAIGAVKSVISDNIDGLLMQPNDKESLCDKILTLAASSDFRSALGNSGYNKTIHNYTWDIVAQKYRETYLLAINKFNNVQRRSNLG